MNHGNIIWLKPDGYVVVSYLAAPIDARSHAIELKTIGNIPSDWEAVAFDYQVPEDVSNENNWRWINDAIVEQ